MQIVWCTQPSQESDALKLKSADTEDPVDFLESLETVLESLVPGSHLWLTKDRSEKFKTCHALSAHQKLGTFYTNGKELKHKWKDKFVPLFMFSIQKHRMNSAFCHLFIESYKF